MSEKKIQASRANGAQSHGPKTEEGKKISSRNALQHGALSKLVVIKGEGAEGFEKMLERYWKEFTPSSQTHEDLIEDLAASRWRLYRAWTMEKATADGAVNLRIPEESDRFAIAGGYSDEERRMNLFMRYETKAHREYDKAYSRLLQLRDRGELNGTGEVAGEPEDAVSPEEEVQPDVLPDAA